MDRNETITAIRSALKARSGKEWSVTGGTGSAWGWIRISVPPKRRGCKQSHDFSDSAIIDQCKCGAFREGNAMQSCPAHICDEQCYRNYITPEDRAELAQLLGKDYVHFQGESIPDSSDYRTEFVARAKGLTPIRHGKQYWD